MEKSKPTARKQDYVWNIIGRVVHVHLIGMYGLFLIFTSGKFLTAVQAIVLVNLGTLGVTCGAHRLWSHRSYKAKTPLKIILLVFQTMAFQMSAINWAKDHRTHHKFSDTDADPHSAGRGLFFSHMGWFMRRRHPENLEKRTTIDISDLTSDPLLRFQKKHYKYCMFFVAFFLPTVVPMVCWDETFVNAFAINVLRFCVGLHITLSINSLAHWAGMKPYDKNILPAENLTVSILCLGEGWHNYHHTFPWDYRAEEYGKYGTNMSTAFLDFMGKIGWAYDMKIASPEIIKQRCLRTGDGTHSLWGLGDEDMTQEDKSGVIVINKKK